MMEKLFLRSDERSFTASVARARFLWLLFAALLLPLAASLSHEAERDRFDRARHGTGAHGTEAIP